MGILKTVVLNLFFLTVTVCTYAQDISIQVLVPTAPPPTTLAEVASFESDVIILLSNTSGSFRDVKLLASITNITRGYNLTMKRGIPSVTPITLAPGEMRELRFRELRAFYGDLTEGDFIIEGFNYEQIIREERLPEGYYSICIEALDYNTDEVLSMEGSCGFFPIIAYDPPIIIYPELGQELVSTIPQNIIFTWTPTGLPQTTKYRFQLVNTEDYQFTNPFDVFNYEDEVFTFQQNDLTTTFFQYDLSQPPLQEGATYSIRVQAYDDLNELNYMNNGWSEPSYFIYQAEDGSVPPIDPNLTTTPSAPNLSTADCETYSESIGTTFNTGVIAGQTISVGAFLMTLDQVTLQGNQTYSGNGRIYVDFLQQEIAVAFESIRINTNNRMFGEESIVYAVNENTNITPLTVSNTYDAPQELSFPNNFNSYLNARRTPMATPLGVPFKIRASEAVASSMIFTPGFSKAKLATPMPYPTVGDTAPFIPYFNNNVCITPEGFTEEEIVFTLNEDLSYPFQNQLVQLQLPQASNFAYLDAADNLTFDFNGQLTFDRSIVRYQSSLQDVSFSFSATQVGSWNMLLDATLERNERVVYPLLSDLPIALNNIRVDLSDQQNPAQFDQKYPDATSLWQGIYCPGIDIQLPTGLGGDALNFNASGLALSGNGLSLRVNRQSQVVNLQNGRLAQWPFSINEFAIDIWEGDLNSGHFNGRLRLPIQQNGGIDYAATISSSNNELELDFVVSDLADFAVPMWKAELEVFAGSTIGLSKIGGAYQLLAELNGRLSIDFNNPAASGSLSQLNIPSLTFEDFTIEGRDIPDFIPKLQFSHIELENPNQRQLSFEFFDFTLNDISVRNPADSPNRYGLQFDLGLSLFGGGILSGAFGAGASTKLTLWARWQDQFTYDGINLQRIEGELDLGIAEAAVAIQLFNRDTTFGNGFKGDADIRLKSSGANFTGDVNAGFSIQFGKVDDYRYWYFDGHYENTIAPGIILGPSGVSLYGFGGGGYYNMTVNSPPPASPVSYSNLSGDLEIDQSDPATTHSAWAFLPQKNNSGFLANSILGSSVSPSSWNVKSNFLMDFNRHPNFAINSVRFEGKLEMMQELTDDTTPDFNLVANSETAFRLQVQRSGQIRSIHASVHHELGGLFSSVSVPVDFHSTYNIAQNTRQWYLHIGSWSQADPFSDDARIAIRRGIDTPVFKLNTDIRAYMMLGNHFPPPTYDGLPPLPSYITNQTDDVGNAGVNRDNSDEDDVLNAMDADTEFGFGIGLGLGAKVAFDLDVPLFYGAMSAEAVVDGILRKTGGCEGQSSFGFNNWYLSGQAYAYVNGEVGVQVRFLGKNRRRSLVNLHAGAVLQAETPNPSWLKGKVLIGGSAFNGRLRFNTRPVNFEFGDRCENIQGGAEHPFAEFDYIGEFIPGDGKKNVSVFVDPRVTFNVNDEEVFEVQDAEGETHTYRVSFDYYLKKAGTSNTVPMQEIHWNDARSALRLTPRDWLEAQTWYEFGILIQGYEWKNGRWGNPIYEDTETSTFQTGNRPNQFVLEDIVSSYPGFRQRYFMVRKDDGERAEGWLTMDKTVCGDILDANQAANMEEGNIIRFTNIRTRTFDETPCWCKNDKTLAFNIPAAKLSGEEIYRINIGFREREGYFTANPGSLDETESTYASNTEFTIDASDAGQYEQLQNEYTDKSEFVNQFKYTNLLDPAAQWYAQTSRYQSYQEKLSSFSVKQTVYIPRMVSYSYEVDVPVLTPVITANHEGAFGKVFNVPVILLDPGGISEPFDHFDIVGYLHPLAEGGRVPPVLNPFHGLSYWFKPRMAALREDQNFENLTNTTLKNIIDDLTAGSPTSRPGTYPHFWEPGRYGPLKRWMQRYNRLERDLQNAGYNLTIQRPAHPLRDAEINRFLDGASDQAIPGGLGALPDPTHGGAGISTVTYGVYSPPEPPIGSSSFQTVEDPSDIDFDPGLDVQSNFTSYYALIDWTPRILNQDRKRANLFAVDQVEQQASQLNFSLYFQALDLLDEKFMETRLPQGAYQIKLVNELDKSFRTYPYQVNR
ncbi:MAG: hypothetical protein AAFZ63_00095 [Bacteroidota bacterium]